MISNLKDLWCRSTCTSLAFLKLKLLARQVGIQVVFEHCVTRCRSAMVASHMSPFTAHLTWMFCWAMSFFQRTAAHPPMAMLQDLQVPGHTGSSRGNISLPGSTAGTGCMSLLIVAAEQNVLCLGLWPRTDARLQVSTGTACLQPTSHSLVLCW